MFSTFEDNSNLSAVLPSNKVSTSPFGFFKSILYLLPIAPVIVIFVFKSPV